MKLFSGAMCELRCGGKIGPIKLLTHNMIGFDGFMWYGGGKYMTEKETVFDIVKVLNPQDAPKVLLSEVEPKVGMMLKSMVGTILTIIFIDAQIVVVEYYCADARRVFPIEPSCFKSYEVVE